MRLFRFVSVKLTLYLIVGIVLGFYLTPSSNVAFVLLAAFLLLLFIAYKRQQRRGFPFFEILTGIITILLGICITTVGSPKNTPDHYSHQNLENAVGWKVNIREVLKPNPYSEKYIVEVLEMEDRDVSGKMLLTINKDSSNQQLFIDDEITLFSRAQVIKPVLNPYEFDYRDYLKKQRIFHQIRIGADEFVSNQNSQKTIFGIAANFRKHLIENLKKQRFDKEELSVIQALLLGQRHDISEETYSDYKNAGAVHILAVSGLHVGILLLLLQFLLQPLERLPKGKTIKLIVVVVFLWGFAFVAGLSPSIVRAVTMFTFLAYALYLNRPTNTFNIISLSMFFILLIKPLFLFQVGFQMSYAAVFAIVWIYPKLQRFWYPENVLTQKIWQLFSVSIAAQLGVLPISLFYFHQFPALFFVSNLLVVPFLGILLGLGILVLALSYFNALPNFLAAIYNTFIKAMNAVVGWVAQQEGFLFRDIPFDHIQLVLGYVIIIGTVVFLSKPKFKHIVFLLSGIFLFQGWMIYKQIDINSKDRLIVPHKMTSTILLHQKGMHLNVITSRTTSLGNIVKDYMVAQHIDSINTSELTNSYRIGEKQLYVMDSLGIYPPTKTIDYLLLVQSPKVNFERLLDSIKPKQVIVDGSNYKSYTKRWKATCLKKEIPFHDTGEKGAFYFEFSD